MIQCVTNVINVLIVKGDVNVVIRKIHVKDIVIDAENFVSDEQEKDFRIKSDEVIKDCLNCMKKRLDFLTYLYD